MAQQESDHLRLLGRITEFLKREDPLAGLDGEPTNHTPVNSQSPSTAEDGLRRLLENSPPQSPLRGVVDALKNSSWQPAPIDTTEMSPEGLAEKLKPWGTLFSIDQQQGTVSCPSVASVSNGVDHPTTD